jgi:hypothetical protein
VKENHISDSERAGAPTTRVDRLAIPTPTTLAAQVTADDTAGIEQSILAIVAALKSGYRPGGRPVTCALPAEYKHLSPSGQADVVNRFRRAGWKIDVIRDQRDGDYLSIEASPASTQSTALR